MRKSGSDNIRPEQLAKEIVAFLNFKGGKILLGVEDNGIVSGVNRKSLEEWVMNVCSDKVHPRIIPYYETETKEPYEGNLHVRVCGGSAG